MSESSEFVSEVFPLALVVQVPVKEFDFSSDVGQMVHLALDFPIDSNTLNFIHETAKDDGIDFRYLFLKVDYKVQRRSANQIVC